MSHPRRPDSQSVSRFIRAKRLLLFAAAMATALGGIVVSESSGVKETFSRLAGHKATAEQRTSITGQARKSVDLFEAVGLPRRKVSPNNLTIPAAPTVAATKTDALFTDVDGDTSADPGDTLKYTVNISASGEDATGVTFTDTVDPNTAFVPGSLTATPVAVNDSYAATGNVRISIAAPGVLGNDFLGLPNASITASPTTSANGGNVTLNADGSFTYNPPPGFEGSDTFSYTLTSSEGSNNAAVTITVSGMIWFVDNNAACPCDGRLTNPFNTLASFNAANNGMGNNPANDDNIFLYESGTDYVGPVTLLNGQRLIGQDAVPSLSAITGLTPPPGSDPYPATNSGNATIVNVTSASNGINVAAGNTLRGFTGGNSGTDISGTNFGTLTIADVTLNGTGQALNLTTGTLSASFNSISSSNSATTGISLSDVGGGLTSSTTTITNPFGIGAIVANSSASLSFGNSSSTQSGDTGVFLNNNTGPIAFGTLNINSPDQNQRGLLATSNSGSITTTGGIISTTGVTAIEITCTSCTTTLGMSLTSVSADGGLNGILVSNTTGTFAVIGNGTTTVGGDGSGGTIQNMTNYGVSLTNAQGLSFTNVNISNIGRNGIDGTDVVGFTFANGTINNVGTAAAGQFEESNISFNDNGTFTNDSVSGAVAITENVLSNARRHGIDIENGSGTISNLTISNNVILSPTSAADSLGNGILVLAQGSAATTANLTTGTINGNTITNFPSGAGIQVGGGNTGSATPATLGGSGTPINITSNNIAGQSALARMGTHAVQVSFNGVNGVSNFNISNNPVLSDVAGLGISVFMAGNVTGTTTINNNVVTANNTAGSAGIAVQVDQATAVTDAPNYNFTINNNNVSLTEGFGIRGIARNSAAVVDMTIQNNTVAAPLLANRNGIRVDAGSGAGDVTLCMFMTGNTSSGSGVNAGLGIRKQGASATINEFGIVGLVPSPATGAQAAAKVAADNPTGGGVDVIAGDNFVSCGITAVNRPETPTQRDHLARTNSGTRPVEKLGSSSHNVGTHNETTTSPMLAKPATSSSKSQARSEVKARGDSQASGQIEASRVSAKSRQRSGRHQQLVQLGERQPSWARALGHHATPSGLQPKVSAALADVMLNIGTLPAGESVTITFKATVDNPFTGPMAQVSNQGTVSGSNFSNVLTDDPDVGGAADPTVTPIVDINPQVTALGPANIWVGLKNSDDVGLRLDLLAEVFKNSTLIGSGQINNVPGGSSGFNNAILRTIAVVQSQSASFGTGDTIKIKLSVRAGSTGHVSGTARLWYNDSAANSRFNVTFDSNTTTYYLLDGFVLGSSPGPGPKKTIDVFVHRNQGGNPFKPFGTWTKTF